MPKKNGSTSKTQTFTSKSTATDILIIYWCNTAFVQRSFEFLAVKLFNNLPPSMKQIKAMSYYIKLIKS